MITQGLGQTGGWINVQGFGPWRIELPPVIDVRTVIELAADGRATLHIREDASVQLKIEEPD